MEREKLNYTPEEAREIIQDDHMNFRVISHELLSHSRWSLHYQTIVQRFADDKFFATTYSKGSTEQQDERPYENESPLFTEVFPVEKTVTVYE